MSYSSVVSEGTRAAWRKHSPFHATVAMMMVRSCMRLVILALLWSSSVAFAGGPEVAIEVPQRLPAWGAASVKVVIRNKAAIPIVPLAIELASDAGSLSAWGIDGACRGSQPGCSIEVRWAWGTPARHRGTAWELLLGGPPPQQAMTPPDALSQDATDQLVRLAPIAAGETVELEVPFVAMYQHGGKLAATVSYALVDPKAFALCNAVEPTQKAFVPCRPITTLGGTMYANHADLVKAQQTIHASATFVVEHPKFDIADARAKAKVTTGAFGFERKDQRWILVGGNRTLVVGASGAIEDLPGDWLQQLIALDSSDTVSVFWNGAPADASAVDKRLRTDHVSFAPFTFKGHTSAERFRITFKRGEVVALAATMRALGYHMTESGIPK